MAGWASSAPAQQPGARYARATLAGLPNAGLGRLRVVSPTASSLPWEKRVRRVRKERAPAVRGALCWAKGE